MTATKPLEPPRHLLQELMNEHVGVLFLHHLLLSLAIGSCVYSAICQEST
jgi:hypothetical protein